jgi:hypothetical protein
VTGSGGGGQTASEIVIYASDVTTMVGAWSKVSDGSAAAGIKLRNPDAGAAAVTGPLASPQNYFETTFNAQAGTRYRVWLRVHPIADSKWNDSVFVQYSDSVDSGGNAIYRIGTPAGYAVNLWTCADCATTGWGWQRNAYWLADTGDVRFQTTGTHTIRVQVREDGAEIDQIVISPATYVNNPPGPTSNDTTIVPKVTSPPPPPPQPPAAPASPSPASGATGVSTSTNLTWSASGATSYDVRFGTATPPPQVSTGQSAASYSPSSLAANTTYYWQIVARNSAGSTAGPVWSFTTAPGGSSGPVDIVIYANDVPQSALHGSWTKSTDSTSPASVKLATPDAGVSNPDQPLASPAHYVDVPFTATAATPYRIWLRLKALANSKFNDAVWVQFSDASAGGAPTYRMGTTSGLLVNLATDSAATSLNGWGWQNGAYWLSQPTIVTFPSSGSRTMRIQVREDGVQIDQIVLSPSTFMNTAPGPVTNDTTIVPKP